MAVTYLTSEVTAATAATYGRLTLTGYTGYEKSLHSGAPEELYLFNEDDTNYWSYTSSSQNITYGGRVYTANLIKRGDINLNANSLKTNLDVTVSITNEFARNFIQGPIERPIKLTIYRRHAGSASDWAVYWNGWVRAIKFLPKKIAITNGLRTAALRRQGLMLKFSRTCQVPLYSSACSILKTDASYFVDGTVTAIDGPAITATVFGTKADGWFLGGIFKTDDSSVIQKIVAHNGTTIKISRTCSQLSVSDTFRAWRGCDHARVTCRNTFSNELNYRGQPYIPNKNPFSGDAIM